MDTRRTAAASEAAGFHGVWVSEISHNPFIAAALAATHTERVAVGTIEEELATAVRTAREQVAFYASTPAYRPGRRRAAARGRGRD